MFAPAVTGSGESDLLTERSAAASTLVVALALLLAGFGSAVTEVTVAVLVITAPTGALTRTTRRKLAYVHGNVTAVATTTPVPPTVGVWSAKGGPEVWRKEIKLVPLGMTSVS